MSRTLLLLPVTLVVLAATPQATPARSESTPQARKADFVLHAGRIWTGDPARPWAESLAAREGTILAVGRRKEIEPLVSARTHVLQLPGSFATPGLVDAHGHLSGLGAGLEVVDLRGAASIQEVVRRVVAHAAKMPAGEWVLGRGWDQSLWPGKELPTHGPLSRALPDRPLLLGRVDGHASWANAAAMRMSGITSDTPDPPGGRILRTPEGEPTGILLDTAVNLVSKQIPTTGRTPLRSRLLAAQQICLRSGLTGVHDAGLSGREIELLRELDRSGQLKLRVYGMASSPKDRMPEFLSRPPPSARPGDRFVLRAIKLFSDGAMGSRGAALFEPYSDDPGNRGLVLTDPALLERITEAALQHGWQVCAHAIGDRGNHLVLEAYAAALKKVPARDPRLRVEHAQLVRVDDIPRFAELGVIASMQPTHATTDKRWAEDRLGPHRLAGAYVWRRFLEAKVTLAFGSDFPVEPADPLLGLYAAVTRQDLDGQPPGGWLPGQRLRMDEALRAFTAGSAFASFTEKSLGALRQDMLCDLSVFDRDLTRVPPRQIPKARVLATVIAGEVVYAQSDKDVHRLIR